MAVTRSTISFNEKNWKFLKKAKNRSKLVNMAVALLVKLDKHAEKQYVKFIEKEIRHYEKTGESYSFEETFS